MRWFGQIKGTMGHFATLDVAKHADVVVCCQPTCLGTWRCLVAVCDNTDNEEPYLLHS